MSRATDIVFVWIDEPPFAQGDLKYALRSWETNWVGNIRMTIVGDNHPQLQDVWHVPHQREAAQLHPKALDSVRKMEAILHLGYIREGFVYTYDDVYLLQPMDELYLRKRYALRELPADFHTQQTSRKHQALLAQTAKVLREHGFKRVWDYETHMPRFYEKRRMQEVIDIYKPAENRLLLATLYFNHWYKHQEPTLLHPMDNVKVTFAGRSTVGVPPPPTTDPHVNMAYYQQHIVGKHILNHTGNGMKDVGLQYLRHSLFPEPSEYEIQPRIQPLHA